LNPQDLHLGYAPVMPFLCAVMLSGKALISTLKKKITINIRKSPVISKRH